MQPKIFKQLFKLALCFLGFQVTSLTSGYDELLLSKIYHLPERIPDGFSSAIATFCVLSHRVLAVIVALAAVRIRHGAFFANNKAPLLAFTPCTLSNTIGSWSRRASLKYVSFPVVTLVKSSKIIPVMIMGNCLKGTNYPYTQYAEAVLITAGGAIFSILSKVSDTNPVTFEVPIIGLLYLITYVFFDSFPIQWQDKLYSQYGRANVDVYQMMLGVNVSEICITTAGLILSGGLPLPVLIEFFHANPDAIRYNIIIAILSVTGQLCYFYMIKEFGPIVFTIIMTTWKLFSMYGYVIIYGGYIFSKAAACGAILVFAVVFNQIRRNYNELAMKHAVDRRKWISVSLT
jgi:solute carrier family 35 (adenosine 3'-phospho 5'-phosphosulfate transporter), member B2